jgi:dihydrofolate reductase
MTKLISSLTISLDGYLAGPDPTQEDPLGVGGEQLHQWLFDLPEWQEMHGRDAEGQTSASSEVVPDRIGDIGAHIMGRNMFGPTGAWDPDWRGWWSDETFAKPVFVLTHHEREPLTTGATTFTFVNDGIESAYAQAKAAAGGKDVALAGGANVFQQAFNAGLLDEFWVTVAPRLLGGGTRLLDNLDAGTVKLARVIEGDGVTHLKYERA